MDFSLSDTQSRFRDSLVEFARRELNHDVAKDDTESRFSWPRWQKLSSMGLTGLCLPESYGGQGADMVTTTVGLEALGYACRDSGIIHALITHLLSALQIAKFGTDRQRETYLPGACRGEIVCAQAITEAESGSDAMAMKTKAEKIDTGYRLNGSKMFISNGPIADVALVLAVTDPGRKSLGRVSSFVVEKGYKGFACGKPFEKMGLRTLMNSELVFEDCLVPTSAILGREGQGMMMFNEGMQYERTLLFACHLGVQRRVQESCIRYARERRQGGQPIAKYQLVAEKITRMIVNLELGRLILYKSAWLIDQQKRSNLESSIAKLFISENLKLACLDAIQIHGAYGYMKEFEIERDLRDSIASTIYSGTSEIQKIIISTLSGL
jgi:alkylation response protein AidB-like acyl-CoA dehydrogenase